MMKLSTKGQITLNKEDRKSLNVKPGDNISFDLKTHKLYKTPTREEWTKLINQLPCEEVGLNKNGTYNTKHAPKFRKWLRNG